MHEYSVVQQLVEGLLKELKGQGAVKVTEVRLRRGSTFAEGPLRQAFQLLGENTPLQGAELVIEEFSVTHTCEQCSHSHVVSAEDLLGHIFICPNCGTPKEIDEAHGLELLGVRVDGAD